MTTAHHSQSTRHAVTKNQDWQDRKERAIARGQGNIFPIYVERAENSELWDVEGNRYIDFASGIAVCNTGHIHPRVKTAMIEQIERFSHSCVMVTPYASAVELAEKLGELVPGDRPKKTTFVTTGAEAVENAVKIARAHTGRRGVVAFHGGFHGRTLLAMGLTGKVDPYKNLFGPFPADVFHVPFPAEYHGVSVDDSIAALEMLFKVDIPTSDVAAIIVEPVQGEGGFYPAPPEFLQRLRTICDEHGIVLVADEIQSGFARTGRFFCTEYAGIEPDLVTIAKGVAGGFPIAAVVGLAEVMDAPLPGGLGGTYAGSPVGCEAALAVIDVIEEENLVEAAQQIGERMGESLRALQARYPDVIGDVRAERGAMVAIELVREGDAERPNPELTKALVAEASQRGLLLLSCGIRGNVIRFLPPLTIPNALLNEGLETLEASLARLIAAE